MSHKRTDLKLLRAAVAKTMPVVDRIRQVVARDQTKNAPWYRINALSALDTEVMIYNEIGEWGVTAIDFVQELKAIATPNISVRINSPGGAVFDGFAIYNALLNHPAKVTAYVDGVAASAASFIAQAADEIIVAEASSMMVHGCSGICIGKKGDMREMAAMMEKLDGQMASIYAQRTERPQGEWMAQMDEDTWYTAEEAVLAGLADRVAEPPKRTTEAAQPLDARTTDTPVATDEPAQASTVDEDDPLWVLFEEGVSR